jgi:hypothetical protein
LGAGYNNPPKTIEKSDATKIVINGDKLLVNDVSRRVAELVEGEIYNNIQ